MKRFIFSTVLFLALGALLTACAGTQGQAILDEGAQIPSTGNGIVDVGNPTEEPETPKAIYINERYGVSVEYPAVWSLEEPNPAQADFSSDDGVALTITFVDLEEGETFESFLTELRGGIDDLHECSTEDFDRAMSNYDLFMKDGKKFFKVERYYLQDQAPHRFVMIQSGIMDAEIITSKMQQGQTPYSTEIIKKARIRSPANMIHMAIEQN